MFCEPSILLSEHEAIVNELNARLRDSEAECAKHTKRLEQAIADLEQVDEMLQDAHEELQDYQEGTTRDDHDTNEFDRLNAVTTCYAAFAIMGSLIAIILANTLTRHEV
jgi:Asp-tRNA(Asn)/Glu-tRNA(Gln) amidotransferase C subunit